MQPQKPNKGRTATTGLHSLKVGTKQLQHASVFKEKCQNLVVTCLLFYFFA